jgi:hypothetical protein
MARKLTSEQMRDFISNVPAFIATIDALIEDRPRSWKALCRQAEYPGYFRLWRYMRGHNEQPTKVNQRGDSDLLSLREYIHLYCVMIGDPTPDLSLDALRPDRVMRDPRPRTPEGRKELAEKREEQARKADEALAIE